MSRWRAQRCRQDTEREIGGTDRAQEQRRCRPQVRVQPIKAGERIVKYGAPIGVATQRHRAGRLVHIHNVTSDYIPTYTLDEGHQFFKEALIMINAYLRADGRKGIRNTIVVAYLVECAHHVSREIVLSVSASKARI